MGPRQQAYEDGHHQRHAERPPGDVEERVLDGKQSVLDPLRQIEEALGRTADGLVFVVKRK